MVEKWDRITRAHGHAATLYSLLLAHGTVMRVQRFTPAERAIIALIHQRFGEFEPRQCFFNSQTLVSRVPSLEYIEGCVSFPGAPMPIDHAWTRLNGKVFDVTLRGAHSYLGVPVPFEVVFEHQLHSRHYSPAIECPRCQPKIFKFQYLRSR